MHFLEEILHGIREDLTLLRKYPVAPRIEAIVKESLSKRLEEAEKMRKILFEPDYQPINTDYTLN